MKISTDFCDVLDGYIYDLASDTFRLITKFKPLENTCTYREPKDRNANTPLIAEELPDGAYDVYAEGAVKQINVNAYERDLGARKACIEYYRKQYGNKVVCWICGFDFGDFYCDAMMDKIHVHHRKLLSEIKKEYQVDPIKDLIPVCPNCHYTIHVLDCTPEYLKDLRANKRHESL